ncbi:hypothetical protein BV20DRAFT_316624 [Pilatotrama ljubarskyi]|nr:hypothetical protein BV20DRAFT_316624 [Pilatotrama ljubarskyi]
MVLFTAPSARFHRLGEPEALDACYDTQDFLRSVRRATYHRNVCLGETGCRPISSAPSPCPSSKSDLREEVANKGARCNDNSLWTPATGVSLFACQAPLCLSYQCWSYRTSLASTVYAANLQMPRGAYISIQLPGMRQGVHTPDASAHYISTLVRL